MIETLNLQSGSFKIVLPYRWQEWLGYVIFGLIAIFGSLMTIGRLGTSNVELVGGLSQIVLQLILRLKYLSFQWSSMSTKLR